MALPEDFLRLSRLLERVWLPATEGCRFRNKSGISQWEALPGSGFLRIHRSFLVNRTFVTGCTTEEVFLGEVSLPVSRKYREQVRSLAEKADFR